MEDDFHRQVDCFLRSRKIKPISATTQESVRAATSEGTKRGETKERQLYQQVHFPASGRKMGFTIFSYSINEHSVQGSSKVCGLLKLVKSWKMLPGKSDMRRLTPAWTDVEGVLKWRAIVSKQTVL